MGLWHMPTLSDSAVVAAAGCGVHKAVVTNQTRYYNCIVFTALSIMVLLAQCQCVFGQLKCGIFAHVQAAEARACPFRGVVI
jgi:hypothetical protein